MHLSKLKSTQLKTLSFLLGLPITGTKAEAQKILRHRVRNPLGPGAFSRILSIDMGVRNLGVCVLEAPHLKSKPEQPKFHDAASVPQPTIAVKAWQKVDVLDLLRQQDGRAFLEPDTPQSTSLQDEDEPRPGSGSSSSSDLFTPAKLSRATYSLVSSLLLQHRPTAILIERQRFRSGGASAVQEWTLRVNLLEHMIWASLNTLRRQRDASVESEQISAMEELETIEAVSPAKVAKFWCGSRVQDMRAAVDDSGNVDGDALGRLNGDSGKITKADKIAVAQSWVDQWRDGQEMGSTRLNFLDSALETARAFQSSPGKRRARRKKGDYEGEVAIGKLDDLADCLLQGVAWIKWEENRRVLEQMMHVEAPAGQDGFLPS